MDNNAELEANTKTPIYPRDNEMVFRVYRVSEGNFRGLWGLEILDSDKVVCLVDADSLSNVIASIGQNMENQGF